MGTIFYLIFFLKLIGLVFFTLSLPRKVDSESSFREISDGTFHNVRVSKSKI